MVEILEEPVQVSGLLQLLVTLLQHGAQLLPHLAQSRGNLTLVHISTPDGLFFTFYPSGLVDMNKS